MTEFIARWNDLAAIWCDRLWAVVWQSTLLTVVVALLAALALRHSSPAVRYWVWTILAIKLLVMPFWTFAAPLPEVPFARSVSNFGIADERAPIDAATLPAFREVDSTPAASAAATVAAAAPEPSVPASLFRTVSWQSWLLLAWAVVVLGQCARIIRQHRSLSRLLIQTHPADDSLAEIVRETANRLGVRQSPRTVITDQDCSPFVCGIRRPTLVLPSHLVSALAPPELTHVLLHELAHIRRLDLVWGWIGEAVRVVYFFHPVAHWISYRLRLERELACDNIAMSVSGQGAAEYAATLVHVVSHASAPSVFRSSVASAGLDGERR